ncbi:ABC transporter ATP-binding protein/permease [Patescibacteria group bacterium]|nr:ABC transporter ATP-binding protein/permease [Patescibacteria group bacterium]
MSDWEEEKITEEERKANFLIMSLKNFLDLLGSKRNEVLIIFSVLVLCQGISLIIPYLFKLIFDDLPTAVLAEEVSAKIVWLIIGMAALQMLHALILRLFVKTKMIKIVIYLENHWPVIAHKKLMDLSPGFHEKENTGKKVGKIEKGCDKMIQLLVDLFWHFLPKSFYLIINIVFVLFIDWRIGLFFTLPIFIAITIMYRCMIKFFDEWEKWEKQKEESSGIFCQSLINVRTVQGFVQEKRENSRLRKIRDSMAELDISVSVRLDRLFLYVNLILNFAFSGSIILGIYLALTKQTSVGNIVFVIATGTGSIDSIIMLVESYYQILRKFVTVNRMKALLDERPDIENRGNKIGSVVGEIKVNNVSFVYSQKTEPVLNQFSLKISPKEMVALVARSGEGKTTLVRLICRMYDVASGEILLDGRDIREFDLYEYRKLFAIVQQDVDIFDGSLRENIIYPYVDSTSEQVHRAIKASYLNSLCDNSERCPEGIETQVGERGIRLSGGERQRVGIARAYIALLNGAIFLILDEATSSLDSEAERAIQEMIDQLRGELNISIIAIAHRLSTIKMADTIYVINDGRVEESGNHKTLLNKNGLYAKLVELQAIGALRD